MISEIFEDGHKVGLFPESSCRLNPFDIQTEEGVEWYAGWYIGYAERNGWKLAKMEDAQVKYLVARIYAHSMRHYEDGWDIVMECMEADEIAAHLTPEMTVTEAINAVAEGEYLEAHNDQRNDALAAGGLPTTNFKKGI